MSPSPNNVVKCNHSLCRRHNGRVRGVGVLIWDYSTKGDVRVLMGRERYGRYKGSFNICSGHMEDTDNNCLVRAAQRELAEEFKVKLDPAVWDEVFRTGREKFRIMYIGPTPIFFGRIRHDRDIVNLNTLRSKIADDNANGDLSNCYREITDVEWFLAKSVAEKRPVYEGIIADDHAQSPTELMIPMSEFSRLGSSEQEAIAKAHHSNNISNNSALRRAASFHCSSGTLSCTASGESQSSPDMDDMSNMNMNVNTVESSGILDAASDSRTHGLKPIRFSALARAVMKKVMSTRDLFF